MKKAKLLSRAEMKEVMGGVPPWCPFDQCWIVIGEWEDGCPENYHCEVIPCDNPGYTYNKCVFGISPEV